MKYFYGVLCVLGLLLPYSAFVPWLVENGLNPAELWYEATREPIARFAWYDVVISAVVLVGFIFVEGIRSGMKGLWLPILGTCIVGVSFGLPLFLCMRETEQQRSSA